MPFFFLSFWRDSSEIPTLCDSKDLTLDLTLGGISEALEWDSLSTECVPGGGFHNMTDMQHDNPRVVRGVMQAEMNPALRPTFPQKANNASLIQGRFR